MRTLLLRFACLQRLPRVGPMMASPRMWTWAGALLLLRSAAACDVCDGVARRKVASGEVLEISDEGLSRLVPAHSLLALLLYKPNDARTEPMQRAYDKTAAELKASGLLEQCVMAQIDAETFHRVAATLNVESIELPVVRILRGDAAFGYSLGWNGTPEQLAALLVEQIGRGSSATARLDVEQLDALERGAGAPGNGTRVVAELSHPRSVWAAEQVAHALRGAVSVALPISAPPTASSPPAAPPVAPPVAPSSRTDENARPDVTRPERVRLIREVSEHTAGDVSALEMPLDFGEVSGEGRRTSEAATAGLTARQLYRWVRWAALPSVFALTPTTATTYLVEGASGIVFLPGVAGSNKTQEYATRRLRRVSERLRNDGDDGLWLLWADRNEDAHARLRMQLGLADRSTPVGAAAPAAAEGEFAIVVMAGARILHSFVMPPPFSFDAVHTHSVAFLRGELLQAKRRAHNMMVLGVSAAVLLVIIGGAPVWRMLWQWCRRGAPVSLRRAPSGNAAGARVAKGMKRE